MINYLTNWCNNCIKQSNSIYSNICYFLLFQTLEPYLLYLWTWCHYGYLTMKYKYSYMFFIFYFHSEDPYDEFLLCSEWKGLKNENDYMLLKQIINRVDISLPDFIPPLLKRRIIYTGAMLDIMKRYNSCYYDICVLNQPEVKISEIFSGKDIYSLYADFNTHVMDNLKQITEQEHLLDITAETEHVITISQIALQLEDIARMERKKQYLKQRQKEEEFKRLKDEYENAIKQKRIEKLKKMEEEKEYIKKQTESLSRAVIGTSIDPHLRQEAQKYLISQYNEKINELEESYIKRQDFRRYEYEV